jgi:hypothetical protein
VLGPGSTIEAGFIHTDDGAIVAGQPEVAASWSRVNDHPIDKASYTFVVTAPADLQVVANGRLLGRQRHGAKRTWVWNAPEPMASYLATVDIGQFDTRRYRTRDGLWMYDALDNLLFALETQTRPVYSKYFFTSPANGDSVIVHELAQFIRLAERVSGEQLDDLFRVWLFTGAKPVLEGATATATAMATATSPSAAATLERARGGQRLRH